MDSPPFACDSVWRGVTVRGGEPLKADTSCDVCIVGGGIAGILTAGALVRDGLRPVILEAGVVMCGGETGRTTAHLVTALDDRIFELERLHGHNGARLALESHRAAIDHVERLARELRIDCDWRRVDGYLAVNDRHADKRDELLAREHAAALRAGATVELAEPPEPWPRGRALRFPGQAQMHPLKLLAGVAEHLAGRGVGMHTATRATHVHGGDDARVETDRGPVVRCGHVVVATNTPINNLVAVHTKQSGYQTYVLAFAVQAGVLPPALFWDGLWEEDISYHYVRLLRGGAAGEDLLIVGGEDHKTGQGPRGDEYRRLEVWTRARFPMCGEIVTRWSGEVMEPADGLAYIGHNAVGRKNVYIVTGDSGNGMTHGAIAAILISDEIAGRKNSWRELYDPARKVGLHGLGDYAKENLNTFAQYTDWLRRGGAATEEEIPPGHGAVVRHGLKHVAVYKDEQGCCTRLNAACTHLLGVVHWNDAEKTWDCPCHASRFDRYGHVMHGPANTDLRPEKPEGERKGERAGRTEVHQNS
jgi:glycine/D-amino acid oxidase-like deaminating enzyme/nitrite reductase/ring-hydroxylating ferredoxin subunit